MTFSPAHQGPQPANGVAKKATNGEKDSAWKQRIFPDNGSSILPYNLEDTGGYFQASPASNRVDFGAFINSMDDASFAYLSLIREYASRPLQGKALAYEGLYRALVSQQAVDESLSRVSVIEFEDDRLRANTFAEYGEFETYLTTEPLDGSLRRLIVLEDLPVRIVCLLGSRLRVHPTIFARHYSTEDSSTVSDDISVLPSIVQTSTEDGLEYASDDESLHDPVKKRSFTLRYPITMPQVSAKQHPDPAKCPFWLKPSERLIDQSAYPRFIVERTLDTPSSYGQWDARGKTSELQGQVTHWHQKLAGGGWNALFLADPCLKDPSHLAVINGAPHPNLSRIVRYPELDDNEKVEIAPNPLQWHPSAAFTKYILHDDILIHYAVADTGPGGNPLAVTPFVRGFVVSKWVAHINYLRRSFAHTRGAFFSDTIRHRHSARRQTNDRATQTHHEVRLGANWKEWLFETMTRFTADMSVYRRNVETNMRALGINVEDAHSYGFVGKREAQMWRVIHSDYTQLQDMFQQLTNSYTQVVALQEAQASNAQAKAVRWLSLLGTFFMPLSVVSGIMFMGGDFLPGEKDFWIYFAVVGPVLLAIGVALGVITGWEKGRLWRREERDRKSKEQPG